MYVSISKDLKSDIDSNIRMMENKELGTVPVPAPLTGSEQFIIDAIWGQHVGLVSLMPKQWRGESNCFRLKLTAEQTGTVEGSIVFNTSKNFPTHPSFRTYDSYSVIGVPPEVRPFIDQFNAHKEISARWSGVRKSVGSFLDSCKSLNEGLKLWPDLSLYIPKSYLDRVAKKVERSVSESNAAAALKEIDTDALTAAVVIARMSQPA